VPPRPPKKETKRDEQSAEFRKRRWICLLAAVLIEALLGVAYARSVFQQPFIDKYGWSISQISTAYTSMYIATMLITLFFGQKIRKALPIRKEIMLGGAVYAAALIGTKHISENYTVTFCAFGLSSFLGPSLVANVRQSTGDYTVAFWIGLGFCVLGGLCALYLCRLKSKRAQQNV